jgi:PAT family beta-lactamase induction signal transducer AmpG
MPKALGGYSGSIVDAVGYETFFTFSALIGLPVIALIVAVSRLIAKD